MVVVLDTWPFTVAALSTVSSASRVTRAVNATVTSAPAGRSASCHVSVCAPRASEATSGSTAWASAPPTVTTALPDTYARPAGRASTTVAPAPSPSAFLNVTA